MKRGPQARGGPRTRVGSQFPGRSPRAQGRQGAGSHALGQCRAARHGAAPTPHARAAPPGRSALLPRAVGSDTRRGSGRGPLLVPAGCPRSYDDPLPRVGGRSSSRPPRRPEGSPSLSRNSGAAGSRCGPPSTPAHRSKARARILPPRPPLPHPSPSAAAVLLVRVAPGKRLGEAGCAARELGARGGRLSAQRCPAGRGDLRLGDPPAGTSPCGCLFDKWRS